MGSQGDKEDIVLHRESWGEEGSWWNENVQGKQSEGSRKEKMAEDRLALEGESACNN